jgi:hypothetical protein
MIVWNIAILPRSVWQNANQRRRRKRRMTG